MQNEDRCAQCKHLRDDHDSKGCFYAFAGKGCDCSEFLDTPTLKGFTVEALETSRSVVETQKAILDEMLEDTRQVGEKLLRIQEEHAQFPSRLSKLGEYYNGWPLRVIASENLGSSLESIRLTVVSAEDAEGEKK